MARGDSPGTADAGDHRQPHSPVAALQGAGGEAAQVAAGDVLSASN